MCGFAGFVGRTREGIAPRLARAAAALRHRGPDAHGRSIAGTTGITATRLAIVGIESGHQPIPTEDGRYTIAGNGEIYNAPELHAALESRGHRFRGGSDIEVILHLFEERGPAALDALSGMFAIAIADPENDRLFVARDRIGIKPLYCSETAAGSACASELPALLALLGTDAPAHDDADPEALWEFLRFGYVSAPRTIHPGVRRLRAGHFAWLTAGGIDERCWWRWPELHPEERPLDAWVDEVESLLADSVRRHTLGDLRAGALLSGGLDSGLVAAFLARAAGAPPPAFTIAFDDPALDERADAALTARALGLEHHVEILPVPSPEDVESLFRAFAEPFADVSLLPTYAVARLAAHDVKFVLTGDGGDELFCGYRWLHREVAWRRLPSPLLGLARCLRPLLEHGQRSRRADLIGKALRAAGDISVDPARSFLRRRSLATAALARRLLHGRLRDGCAAAGATPGERHAAAWTGDPMTLLQDLDRRFYLAGDILEKVDRATMMHSLEARVPFLDHRLVALAARIPLAVHLGGDRRGKAILRSIAGRVLPPEVLSRPKRGFGIPVDRWLRGTLSDALRARLLDPAFESRALLEPAPVHLLLDEHASGRSNHGHLLWGLWSLAAWAAAGDRAGNHGRPAGDLISIARE